MEDEEVGDDEEELECEECGDEEIEKVKAPKEERVVK